jgi:hypothetical protein
MVYDRAHDLYLPCFYILVDSKEEWCYWNVFHWLKVQCDLKLDPGTVSCDFEYSLQKGIRDQFPEAHIVGCLFHWKQALRRKLISLRVPIEQVKVAMGKGVLDILTVLPVGEIEEKGIPYVRSLINCDGSRGKWNEFWRYFVTTWMQKYPVESWNIHEMLQLNSEIVNRTNNPLESYNRAFTSEFNRSHPPLMAFLDVCKKESYKYVRQFNDVRAGIQEPPRHAEEPSYPSIPESLL